ncbi:MULTISPECIES: Flp family type IVb pilin [unclassified Methylobacterium]|uniref:Flp family type IVb pilin n=1 Tax=unclassified Methylobacterium TaxID=2615210 RepID=UPI0003A43278|nr:MULTISPECIES: hypothetical protein [Methylobacterium]WFT79471.1 hypothetical protein QA634_30370 [Methylobacterium nodulans]
MRLFLCDSSGSTAIEYVMIAGFIFLALVGGLSLYGNQTGNLYANFSSQVVNVLSKP